MPFKVTTVIFLASSLTALLATATAPPEEDMPCRSCCQGAAGLPGVPGIPGNHGPYGPTGPKGDVGSPGDGVRYLA